MNEIKDINNPLPIKSARVRYLVSLDLTPHNLAKRKWRAKNKFNEEEYLCLCLAEGIMLFNKKWEGCNK